MPKNLIFCKTIFLKTHSFGMQHAKPFIAFISIHIHQFYKAFSKASYRPIILTVFVFCIRSIIFKFLF